MRNTLLACVLFSLACSHTKTERPNLDIDTAAAGKFDIKDANNIEPSKIFEWQKYYKTPPAGPERDAIALSVANTTAGSSIEDKLKAARNALAIGERSKSKELYTDVLKDNSEQLDAQLEMTHIYLAENDVERAFDYLTSVKKILEKTERPTKDYTIRYRYALAQAYMKGQNRDQGHQILTDLIEVEPKFTLAYAALAQSYMENGKNDLAEFVLKRGLDQDARDPRLMNLLAVMHIKAGRLPEAREWINKALEQDPNFVPALVNRAQLAMQRREYVASENDLKRACALEPLNADAHITMGLLYRQTGRITASKGSFEHAMEIAPLNSLARYQLASLLQDEFKDKTTALQLYYDVLQAQDQELKNLANIQIQSIRDSRLYQ
ncbi:MAG: tetratricopeptide repeat protein [Chitinophagaceae bacterium]|nr:tetratricopeptide repeat protein [Oligoflexus sp.]